MALPGFVVLFSRGPWTWLTFQEWPLAAAVYLNKPSEHEKWVCGVPEKFKQKWPNVQYFLSSVEAIDCDKKDHEGLDSIDGCPTLMMEGF